MFHSLPPLRSLAVLLFGASVTQAELAWDVAQLSLRPPPGAHEVQADFEFTNRSAAPVTITEVTPSCGCVSAVASRKTVPAGDRGKIHAVFKTSGTVGHLSKSIRVLTDETGAPPMTLHLDIELLPAYTISPRRLHWKLNAEPAPERVDVIVAGDANVGAPKLKSVPIGFDIKVDSTGLPGHYQITATPHSTAVPQRGIVAIEFAKMSASEGTPQVLLIVE